MTTDDDSELGPRERQVAQMLLQGRAQKEIAATLHVAPLTVSAHLSHIYSKLGAKSKAESLSKLRLTDALSQTGAPKAEGTNGA